MPDCNFSRWDIHICVPMNGLDKATARRYWAVATRPMPLFSHMCLVSQFPSSPWAAPRSTALLCPRFLASLVLSSAAATSSGGVENRGRRPPKDARPFMAATTSGGGCIGVNEIGTFTVTCPVVGGGSASAAPPAWEELVPPTNLPALDVCLDPDSDGGESAVLIRARSSASVGGRPLG